MPTVKPPAEETDECTSTQLCSLVGNCNNSSLIDREDCEEQASTPTSCVAAGCCWEGQAPGPIPDDLEENGHHGAIMLLYNFIIFSFL